MNLFALLTFTVYASELLVSPLPDDWQPEAQAPTVSFGQLVLPASQPDVAAAETPTPSPSPTPQTPYKKRFVIGVLGDSMVDTLGPQVPNLKEELSSSYPDVHFTLLNYGVGGTNIDYGVTRITNDYDYIGQHVPALVSQNPDIVVIESFAYNPYSFDVGALDKHWLALSAAVDTLKTHLPQIEIIIAATIAPNATVFGDGAPGISYDSFAKQQKVTTIKQYLESTVAFAKSQKLPLADAYHSSLDETGNGKLVYINPGDHIHYSDEGRTFFAEKVAETILSNHLLE